MLVTILILASLCIFCNGSEEPVFRYDYKYYKEANVWMKMHMIPMEWSNAKLKCHLEGAILASPLNKTLQVAITKVMQEQKTCPTCIFSGVNNLFSEAVYASIEGVPLERMPIHWSLCEPAFFRTGCLVFFSNGTMGNKNCNDTYPFICYRKNTNFNINECGTIDNGYHLKKGTYNTCFKYHSEEVGWSEAFAICHAEGAHLTTTIDSVDWLVGNELGNKKLAFAGFKCLNGTWWDINGNVMNVQPSVSDEETCGGISDGKFSALSCDPHPFICEKRVDSLNATESSGLAHSQADDPQDPPAKTTTGIDYYDFEPPRLRIPWSPSRKNLGYDN